MKTKRQIADEAKQLADVLANKDGSLIQRTLWQLASLIQQLAESDARVCARPKCSVQATVTTGLCVEHSIKALEDSIDRADRSRKKQP